MAKNRKSKRPYYMTRKTKDKLKNAINSYNEAVRMARRKAGFEEYNIEGLAMPTTLANTLRRIDNAKHAKKVIDNLLEFTKPGAVDFDYKVDPLTGEVTDIRFKAQTAQIERQLAKENKLRQKVKNYVISKQDDEVYNPQLRYALPQVTKEFIEKKHKTGPVDLGTMDPVIEARTRNWVKNYTNRLQTSLDTEQMLAGTLKSTEDRVKKLIAAIENASIEQINAAIYGTTVAGDIKEGPYEQSISLYLDTLLSEWGGVLGIDFNEGYYY